MWSPNNFCLVSYLHFILHSVHEPIGKSFRGPKVNVQLLLGYLYAIRFLHASAALKVGFSVSQTSAISGCGRLRSQNKITNAMVRRITAATVW